MSILLLLLPVFGLINIYITKEIKSKIYAGINWSILNLMINVLLIFIYDSNNTMYQFKYFISNKLITGVDGISLWLILLVNIITPIVLLLSWRTFKENNGSLEKYILLIYLVYFWSLAVFLVLDIFLFYISFESVLIPMYFLIGYYGSRNKKIEEAQNKFFKYTLKGSLFLLLSIIILYIQLGTTDYELLNIGLISREYQKYIWLGFFIAFAVKTPKWPVHIWLPIAHGESSTGVSVILAAILLKLGTYGIFRYCFFCVPLGNEIFLPLILMLASISVIYSCISAFSLLDFKAIVAYSSIGHMNISIIGIFSNELSGLTGSYLYSISHGLISGGLFILVGVLYDRYHTRVVKYYRGLVLIMPLYVLMLFLFTLFNLSFPLSLGFIAEFLIFISTIKLSPFITILATSVSILLPYYFLWTYQRISFGSFSNYLPTLYQDLNIKEFMILSPLLILTIIFGLFPHLIIEDILKNLLILIR